MTIVFEERQSPSPYIETVTKGQTLSAGSSLRPAESHWHMVFVKVDGRVRPLAVGPLTSAGIASWGEGAEILWIKFRLGTFMPGLPAGRLRDREMPLAEASRQFLWLDGCAWSLPSFESAEAFVAKLARSELLTRDPIVAAALDDRPQATPPRTVRHHFQRATGLSQSYIRQLERAQQAATMLRQGASIGDAVFEGGFFDQPHLTRSLKRFIGKTPAQISQQGSPA